MNGPRMEAIPDAVSNSNGDAQSPITLEEKVANLISEAILKADEIFKDNKKLKEVSFVLPRTRSRFPEKIFVVTRPLSITERNRSLVYKRPSKDADTQVEAQVKVLSQLIAGYYGLELPEGITYKRVNVPDAKKVKRDTGKSKKGKAKNASKEKVKDKRENRPSKAKIASKKKKASKTKKAANLEAASYEKTKNKKTRGQGGKPKMAAAPAVEARTLAPAAKASK